MTSYRLVAYVYLIKTRKALFFEVYKAKTSLKTGGFFRYVAKSRLFCFG